MKELTVVGVTATGSFAHRKMISVVKRVEFAGDRMSYIILGDHWCHITVQNFHTPRVEKIDEVKNSIQGIGTCI
jgi:hypothetical protein